MKNGENGIDIRTDTFFGAWGQKVPMKIETPFRCQGGNIQCYHLGAFTYINDNCYIRAVKSIGRFCAIGPNLTVGFPEHSSKSVSSHIIFPHHDSNWMDKFTDYGYDNEHSINIIRKGQNEELRDKGMVTIGNDVWIGGNVTILRGCNIGDGAIMAAGAVVTKDVQPYSIIGGVPAKIIRYRFSDDCIEQLMKYKWWEYGPEIMKGCDITNTIDTLKTINNRIKNGFPKYNSEEITITFDPESIVPPVKEEPGNDLNKKSILKSIF